VKNVNGDTWCVVIFISSNAATLYKARQSLDCRWYFDFQLLSEVLVKKSAKFERKFEDCKNLHRYFGISAYTSYT